MSDLLDEFERECAAAHIEPTAALREGGVHPTLWRKWAVDGKSPTLRSFEAAKRGLDSLRRKRASSATPNEAAA